MSIENSPYGVIPSSAVAHWDDETDIVIIGLGGGGASAAIEAGAAGTKVVILERASGGGGLTASAGGHLYMGDLPTTARTPECLMQSGRMGV